jgi:pimeloyl-ACP methyl ester carboxylesterase
VYKGDDLGGQNGNPRLKRGIDMHRLPVSVLKFLALAVFLMSSVPARSQESVVVSPDIFVPSDNYSIHVRHKVGAEPGKTPVLLVHGTWGNSQTWDFPDRSVMDHLAVRGYDVYALDLRGMGGSLPAPVAPADYFPIDLLGRVRDVKAVSQYISATTGRVPVVMGWSQGGLITALLAASDPQRQFAIGVGLLSVGQGGFVIPQSVSGDLVRILFSQFPEALTPTPTEIGEIIFGTDPITGKSTISPDALATFAAPPFLQPESSIAVVEETNLCPLSPPVVNACPAQTLAPGNITVPALVADGALDPLVGEELASELFESLGSTNKRLVIFPRNSHGWFLENNHDATMRVFDHFLSQFPSGESISSR